MQENAISKLTKGVGVNLTSVVLWSLVRHGSQRQQHLFHPRAFQLKGAPGEMIQDSWAASECDSFSTKVGTKAQLTFL